MSIRVICGKVEDALPRFPRHYFDALFGDPPYGFPGGFMGRQWDNLGAGAKLSMWHRAWLEAARPKLRPGGNVIAASGSRVYHRLASGAEDAGLEILPLFAAIHSMAMAQGADLSKLIDKAAAEREVIGSAVYGDGHVQRNRVHRVPVSEVAGGGPDSDRRHITAPATLAAKLWSGYATRLKDCVTPWGMFRVPFDGPSYRNALEHGVGGYNIEAGRVPTGDNLNGGRYSEHGDGEADGNAYGSGINQRTPGGYTEKTGRYPSSACLIHAEDCTADACAPGCAVAEMDEQSGQLASGPAGGAISTRPNVAIRRQRIEYGADAPPYDKGGGASRFYHQFRYHAKAGRGERMRGCESFFWRVDRDNPLGFVRIGIDEYLAMGHLPGCRKRLKPKRKGGGRQRRRPHLVDSRKAETWDGDESEDPDLPLFDILAADMADLPEPGCAPGCQHRMRYQGSIHPTLKPISLCRYLAGLILPPPTGRPRRLLIPFAGTFSEAIGAVLAGWDEVVVIESEAVYCELGAARAAAWLGEVDVEQGELF